MSAKECNIKVFVRVRPFIENEKQDKLFTYLTSNELFINDRKFIYDMVFKPSSNQIEVYTNVIKPTIKDLFSGYNCSVLAYGCTGTGKTFTLFGDNGLDLKEYGQDSLAGCIPRATMQIFQQIATLQLQATVKISFLEMYNEEIHDLLNSNDNASPLNLYADPRKKGSVCLSNLEEIQVKNYKQASNLIMGGIQKRLRAATNSNQRLSRSHAIFILTVSVTETNSKGEQFQKVGKLTLVDLAGSESLYRKNLNEKRGTESSNINKSLWTLGRVIQALTEKGAAHVPYRDSKLTRLLQDSLGGNTKTCIIATVGPSLAEQDNTLNTLEYAFRARKITNCPEINIKVREEELYEKMSAELQSLKRDLDALHSASGYYVDMANYENMKASLRSFQEKVHVQEQFLNELKLKLEQCQQDKENINNEYEKLNKLLSKGSVLVVNYKAKIHEKDLELAKERFMVDYYENIESQINELTRRLLQINNQLVNEHGIMYSRLHELYETNKMIVKTVLETFSVIQNCLECTASIDLQNNQELIQKNISALSLAVEEALTILKNEFYTVPQINVKNRLFPIYEQYYMECHEALSKLTEEGDHLVNQTITKPTILTECEHIGEILFKENTSSVKRSQKQLENEIFDGSKKVFDKIDSLINDLGLEIEEDEKQLKVLDRRIKNCEKHSKMCTDLKNELSTQRDSNIEKHNNMFASFKETSHNHVARLEQNIQTIKEDLLNKNKYFCSYNKHVKENITEQTEKFVMKIQEEAASLNKEIEESNRKLFFSNQEKCTNLHEKLVKPIQETIRDIEVISESFHGAVELFDVNHSTIKNEIESCLKNIPVVKRENIECDNQIDFDVCELIEFPSKQMVCEMFYDKLAKGEIDLESSPVLNGNIQNNSL